MHDHNEDPEALARAEALGYEERDVNFDSLGRSLSAFTVFMLVSFGIGYVCMIALFKVTGHGDMQKQNSLAKARRMPDGPILQTGVSAKQDIVDLRALEIKTMTTYQMDETKGMGRVPIDRAIDMLSSEGLPKAGGK